MSGNFVVSYIIRARDNFTSVSQKISESMRTMHERVISVNKGLFETADRMDKVGKGMFKKITLPIMAFAASAVYSAASVERLSVSLGVMTGSTANAKKVMDDLLNVAKDAPFVFKELGQSAKILLSTKKFTPDTVINEVKKLGDIASIYDIDLESLSALYAKVINQNKVMGEDIAQLQTSYGIPIIDEFIQLAKEQSNVTLNPKQLLDAASKGQIGAEALRKVFNKMISEGGTAFQGMTKTTNTISGAFTKFKDVMFLTAANFGSVIANTYHLKDRVKSLGETLHHASEQFEALSKNNPFLTKMIVWAVSFVAALGPLVIICGVLVKWFALIKTALIAIRIVSFALLGPWGLLLAAIIAVIAAIQNFDKLKSNVMDNWKAKNDRMMSTDKKAFHTGWTSRVGRLMDEKNSPTSPVVDATKIGPSSNAYASMDINIVDRNKNVKSVTSSQDGFNRFNLGMNNAPAMSRWSGG